MQPNVLSSIEEKNFSLLPARMALGASMTYHGFSKLRADGPQKTGQFFEQLGLTPGKFWATATGVAELFAGVSALLGFGTRLAALAVLATQAVAIRKVHAPKGYDISQGGFEYNLALMGIALGLLLTGPGEISLHERVRRMADARAPRKFFRKKARRNVLSSWLGLLK